MEYKEVVCRNCGGHMKLAPGATRIRCEYCETEYILSSEKKQNEVQIIDYAGRGPLFKSYVPAGWTVRVFDDESYSSLATVCKGLHISTNNATIQLLFLPFAYYINSQPTSILPMFSGKKTRNFGSDSQFNGLTLTRHRKLVPVPQYAYERISLISSSLQIQLEPLSCECLREKANQFQQTASRKLEKPVRVEPGKFHFQLYSNNVLYEGYFATILASVDKSPSGEQKNVNDFLKKGLAMMGAMYGIGGISSYDWGRAFDILLIYPQTEKDKADYESILDRFIAELDYGPVYYALQEEEQQRTQQIQINGAMQRQQTAINASQRISRTLSETSDIVNQAYWDRSQVMDNMSRKTSEAIRGVNSYTDSTGQAYEADVRYDHIYRNGNTFVGSQDGSAYLGPGWEELTRRD